MSMPFYVAPEQMMKDRADYARKGIARGRSLAAVTYDDGILIVAENPSSTLRKVSEIYDRIAFGGVGRYNEYDQLRVAGVRAADLKGYAYSRDDVDARSLANQYSQILGQIFTHEVKPMEVEILVAEVREEPRGDQMFHILYDGTVVDEHRYSVLGGDSEVIAERVAETWSRGPVSAATRCKVAVGALAGPERTLGPDDLEVALLARSNGRRAFRRLEDDQVRDLSQLTFVIAPRVARTVVGARPSGGTSMRIDATQRSRSRSRCSPARSSAACGDDSRQQRRRRRRRSGSDNADHDHARQSTTYKFEMTGEATGGFVQVDVRERRRGAPHRRPVQAAGRQDIRRRAARSSTQRGESPIPRPSPRSSTATRRPRSTARPACSRRATRRRPSRTSRRAATCSCASCPSPDGSRTSRWAWSPTSRSAKATRRRPRRKGTIESPTTSITVPDGVAVGHLRGDEQRIDASDVQHGRSDRRVDRRLRRGDQRVLRIDRHRRDRAARAPRAARRRLQRDDAARRDGLHRHRPRSRVAT